MKKWFIAASLLCFSQFSFAQASAADCEAKALDKNGKPLHGAAKSAFMKKCTGTAHSPAAQSQCEDKAVDKNGKPLHGAAKSAFMRKCTQDAQAAK